MVERERESDRERDKVTERKEEKKQSNQSDKRGSDLTTARFDFLGITKPACITESVVREKMVLGGGGCFGILIF